MTGYVISDIHVDFYIPQTMDDGERIPHFEKFFSEHFLPADALLLAGDIANDYHTQVGFLQFIAGKYQSVYVVNGNHDLLIKNNTTFGNGNPFRHSEDRMAAVKDAVAGYPGVHVLEGDVVDGIGGCMGFADFMYGERPGLSMYYWKKNFIDGRGWNFKRNRADVISGYYKDMIAGVLAMKPRIMMTHYCPVQMGVSTEYADDPFTPCFYFDGGRMMDGAGCPEIWICGHTHDQYDTDWTDASGMHHRILCNPLGYPDDRNDFARHLAAGTYLIEL